MTPEREPQPTPPPPIPDEVFGFWFRGIWQPVCVGVTVEAVSTEQITFHYPPP